MEKTKLIRGTAGKILSLLAGTAVAVLFALPYFLFREQLQQYALVGYGALALSCAVSNASVLLPASSTLIVLSAATALDPVLCVLWGGVGTALGEQVSYFCGRIGSAGFSAKDAAGQVGTWLKRHGFLTVFLFALVPLPVFDVAGLGAGAMKMNWLRFTVAAVLGKTLKFAVTVFGVFCVLPVMIPYIPGPGRVILETFLNTLMP